MLGIKLQFSHFCWFDRGEYNRHILTEWKGISSSVARHENAASEEEFIHSFIRLSIHPSICWTAALFDPELTPFSDAPLMESQERPHPKWIRRRRRRRRRLCSEMDGGNLFMVSKGTKDGHTKTFHPIPMDKWHDQYSTGWLAQLSPMVYYINQGNYCHSRWIQITVI